MSTATVESLREFMLRGLHMFEQLDGSFLSIVHPDYTVYHDPKYPLMPASVMREKLFERYAVLKSIKYTPTFLDLFVEGSAGVAVFELGVKSCFRDGTETSGYYRITIVSVLHDHEWKIRHDHSTPLPVPPAWAA